MPLYDALLDFEIKHHLARHEQGAAFAAMGFARSSNTPGICFGTSGPGATNLLTSLADALLDSVPLLVITGQVPSTAMGSDAFQEVDVLGLSLSVTKHSYLVADVNELPRILSEAYELCQQGRPGPVLVDVPKDILLTELQDDFLEDGNETAKSPTKKCSSESANSLVYSNSLAPEFDLKTQVKHANTLLANASRPLAYLGGGIAMGDALHELECFLSEARIPCVSTLKGLGSAPADYPYDLGMLGMHGLKQANIAVQSCDVLLVLGARLDDRATGKLSEFAPNAKVIHIDIDAAELHKRRFADVAINGNCKDIIPLLNRRFAVDDWRDQIEQNLDSFQHRYHETNELNAPDLLNKLANIAPQNTIFTCDVGQHQMWAAQHLRFASPLHHLSSGGLGTMGFGLPAAIGASVANPENQVITISGDGSFMMNVQELATVKRYDLPVKIIVLDNQRLGMVKQWQELFHEQRYSETDLSDNPEFSLVANAFGIHAKTLDSHENADAVLRDFVAYPKAMLLHVKLNADHNVWPIVPPNTANHKMLDEHHELSN